MRPMLHGRNSAHPTACMRGEGQVRQLWVGWVLLMWHLWLCCSRPCPCCCACWAGWAVIGIHKAGMVHACGVAAEPCVHRGRLDEYVAVAAAVCVGVQAARTVPLCIHVKERGHVLVSCSKEGRPPGLSSTGY